MQGSAGCLAADRPLSFLSSGAQTETPAIERMRQLSRVGAALVGDVGHGQARALVPWRDPFSWVDFCALCSDHRAEVSPRQETRRAFVTFVTVDGRKAAAHSGGFRGPLRAVPVTRFYRIPHPLEIWRLQNSTERSCTPLTLRRLCIYNSA